MLEIFRPIPHQSKMADDFVVNTYKEERIKIFIGIFIGYTGYYLVRKNFTLAMPYLIDEMGYSRGDLGVVLSAISIAYGLSKFLMGTVSDRSNPRIFLTVGLLCSSLIMFSFAFIPWVTNSIAAMFVLLFLNGWFQGMGLPACCRTIVHWWSTRERGRIFPLWNVSHNVGGGLVGPLFLIGLFLFHDDWRSAFYVPAFFAVLCAFAAYLLMKDTPQSCGLPPIEEYNNDFPDNYDEGSEEDLSVREIFFKYVLNNKALWYIAVANVFISLVRYGVLDWAPTYLSEVKGFSVNDTSWAYFFFEWAGIPGALFCGWVADKLFKGNSAKAGIVFMVLVLIAILVYWFNPAGNLTIDMLALIAIGFMIYGPVMLVTLFSLGLVPKKAVCTASGLTGLFGYLGGVFCANAVLGYTVDSFGWDGGFILLVGSCILTVVFLWLAMESNKKTNIRH